MRAYPPLLLSCSFWGALVLPYGIISLQLSVRHLESSPIHFAVTIPQLRVCPAPGTKQDISWAICQQVSLCAQPHPRENQGYGRV